jgi:RNA polymerase sigma-70 factor (ECF subfamily)
VIKIAPPGKAPECILEPMSLPRALVEGYRTAAAAASRATSLEASALESVLIQLYANGSAAHPDIDVDPTRFGTYVADCNTPLDGESQTLPAGDLFLACAALAGNRTALGKLQQISLSPIRSYVRRIELPVSSVDDIAQELWSVLLEGGADRVPKLARYSGTGSLRSFIGVTARRLALMRCRTEEVKARAGARLATEVNALADDVELDFIKAEYREAFRRAIEDALVGLDKRLRMVLRMRILDNLTVEAIARAYGVAQSSVSRWLEKAREQVVSETRRLLCERLLLSGAEFDSLWRLVASQLEISVSDVLGCSDVSRSGNA